MARRTRIWDLRLFLILLALCFFRGIPEGQATEYLPWLGNIYEFELRPSLLYQGYSQLSTGSHSVHYPSNDLFFNVRLANALPTIGLEAEITEAFTKHQQGDIDHLKLTGRYVWLDDIAGDPVSLTSGLSYIQAFKDSLHDVSSFHHGYYEGEGFVSIGKEQPSETEWGSRWWSVFGVGLAEKGSPWLRFNVTYEKRWWEKNEWRLFAHSLWGLGHKRLHHHHFHGYGPIQHQSIDLGIRYTYLLDYFGSASLEYSYRVYARNFPLYTHHVLAQVLYTFGL